MNNIRQKDDIRINLITELANFFEKHGIKYLLALGTARKFYEDRGIFRPNKEHDIDFFVWSNYFDNLQNSLKELKNSGWAVKSIKHYKVQLEKNVNVKITVEIIFLYKENDKVYFSTSDPKNGITCYPEAFFEVNKCEIGGEKVFVVSELFCKQHYNQV